MRAGRSSAPPEPYLPLDSGVAHRRARVCAWRPAFPVLGTSLMRSHYSGDYGALITNAVAFFGVAGVRAPGVCRGALGVKTIRPVRWFLARPGPTKHGVMAMKSYNVIEIVLAWTEAYRVPRAYKDKHFLEAQKSIGLVACVLFRSHCRCDSRCGRRLLNNYISASRATRANQSILLCLHLQRVLRQKTMVSPKCKVVLLYAADQGDDMTKTQRKPSPWTCAPRISSIYVFSRCPVSRRPAMMISMTLYTSTIAPYGAPKQIETKSIRGALACQRRETLVEALRRTTQNFSPDGHR